MSKGNNIFKPFVDAGYDAYKLSCKLIYKMLNVEEYYNIEEFFKTIEFKNKKNMYPKQIKIFTSEKGYTYLLSVPAGISLKNFNDIKGSLELQLKNKVEIRERKGYVEIEVISKQLAKNIPYKLPIKVKKPSIKFPIGESLSETIYLDLKENPHSYVVGTTGSGKSVCTKSILTSIVNLYSPAELELYLCDLKRVELNLFSKMQHTKKFVYTVEDTTEVIADLLSETNRRYDLFMKHNVTSIFEYNNLQSVKKLKYQVLFLEEAVILLEDKKKTAMKLLKQLMAISRASGCYIFLTTQRPSTDIIDNVVKSLISNRIVFKVEDTKNSIICLDKEGAEKLRGKGHGIFKVGPDIQEFQSYFIEDKQVKELTKQYTVKKKIKNKKGNNVVEYKKIEPIKSKNKVDDLSFLDNI